jgi:hypothetical protein
MIARQKKIDELRILKELFLKDMPIDETKKKNIIDSFSRMEKAIFNNEPVQRDYFDPPDDEAVDGSRVYKYYPSLSPQKLESGDSEPRGGPDVDHRESKSSVVSPAKGKSSTTQDVEHVSHDT